jgi:hypothetical protein
MRKIGPGHSSELMVIYKVDSPVQEILSPFFPLQSQVPHPQTSIQVVFGYFSLCGLGQSEIKSPPADPFHLVSGTEVRQKEGIDLTGHDCLRILLNDDHEIQFIDVFFVWM